jgi:competence protein ComEC
VLTAFGCCSRFPVSVQDFRDFLHINQTPAGGHLVLTFFVVGLGDAVLLEFPGGRTLLVDAGVGWDVDTIVNYLEARGIRHLDGMLLTHPHYDHYGGLESVTNRVDVKQFFSNGVDNPASKYQEVLALLDEKQVPRRILRRGDTLNQLAGGGVAVEVLYPDGEALLSTSNLNAGTIVLRVSHGDVVVLLTGDAEKREEKRLLEMEGDRLAASVLKLGHHASMLSGTDEFLETVNPEIAVAQGTKLADIHPFYPRPSYHIRLALKRMCIPLLTTKHEGTIQVVSDGASVRWRTMAGSIEAIEALRSGREARSLHQAAR